MKLPGHLQVDGNIEAANIPSEFYGITVKLHDDTAASKSVNVISFDQDWFYLSQNPTNTDEAGVNYRVNRALLETEFMPIEFKDVDGNALAFTGSMATNVSTGEALLTINSLAGETAGLRLVDKGDIKWILSKASNNTFSIFDWVNNQTPLNIQQGAGDQALQFKNDNTIKTNTAELTVVGRINFRGGVIGFYLGNSEDVNTGGAEEDDVLKFNAVTGVWGPEAESAGGVTFTDGTNSYPNASELNFNSDDFYLSGTTDSPATPVVNTRRHFLMIGRSGTQTGLGYTGTGNVFQYNVAGGMGENITFNTSTFTATLAANHTYKMTLAPQIGFDSGNIGANDRAFLAFTDPDDSDSRYEDSFTNSVGNVEILNHQVDIDPVAENNTYGSNNRTEEEIPVKTIFLRVGSVNKKVRITGQSITGTVDSFHNRSWWTIEQVD